MAVWASWYGVVPLFSLECLLAGSMFFAKHYIIIMLCAADNERGLCRHSVEASSWSQTHLLLSDLAASKVGKAAMLHTSTLS